MPVQGRPASPLGYASSQARQAGTGASTVSLLQELQVVRSLQGDQDPGADMPSSRDALPSRGGRSLRDALSSREGLASRNALPSHGVPPLRPTLLPEPPLAPAKTRIFASTARLMVVILTAGGALGFLWVTLVSLRGTPRPAAQSVAAEQAPDPSATVEQAAGAALYQEFLTWRQSRGR